MVVLTSLCPKLTHASLSSVCLFGKMAWTWRQGSVTRVVHDIFGAIGYFSIVIALTHAVVALSHIIMSHTASWPIRFNYLIFHHLPSVHYTYCSPSDFELVWFVLVQWWPRCPASLVLSCMIVWYILQGLGIFSCYFEIQRCVFGLCPKLSSCLFRCWCWRVYFNCRSGHFRH